MTLPYTWSQRTPRNIKVEVKRAGKSYGRCSSCQTPITTGTIYVHVRMFKTGNWRLPYPELKEEGRRHIACAPLDWEPTVHINGVHLTPPTAFQVLKETFGAKIAHELIGFLSTFNVEAPAQLEWDTHHRKPHAVKRAS